MTRRILIMGGSRGIGRARALHLARAEAAHLVLLGRDAGTLADTSRAIGAAGGTADIFVANVTERTRLAEVAQHLGPLDGLVAAAGISGMTPVDRDSDVFFNEILGGRPHGPLEYRAGQVDTDMAKTGIRQVAAATRQTEAQFRAKAEAAVPVKRFFEPAGIAHGIAWLLDPSNTMQVGQCLNLDGGVVQT